MTILSFLQKMHRSFGMIWMANSNNSIIIYSQIKTKKEKLNVDYIKKLNSYV